MKIVSIGITFSLCILFQSNLLAQWELLQPWSCNSLDFVNDSTGLATSNTVDGCFIVKTTDYGITWDTVLAYPPAYWFSDVVYASSDMAFMVGGSNLILKSMDGGNTWYDPSEVDDPFFSDVYFVDSEHGYASNSGAAHKLGTTSDGGESWSIFTNAGANDLSFFDSCHGLFGEGFGLISTDDCGEQWSLINQEANNRNRQTSFFLDSQTGFLGAIGGFGSWYDFNFGSILKTIDGGENYLIQDIPYCVQINDLFFTTTENGFAAAEPQAFHPYSILKTEDGGESWGYQDIDLFPQTDDYPRLLEMDCPSAQYCYAGGDGIYRTTNGGGEIHGGWFITQVESNNGQDAFQVWPNPTYGAVQVAIPQIAVDDNLEICGFDGKIVFQRKINGALNQIMDMESYPAGIYLVKLRNTGFSLRVCKI